MITSRTAEKSLSHTWAGFGRQLKVLYRRWRAAALGLASVVTFTLIWETSGRTGLISKYFASYPTAIAQKGLEMFISGEIYDDIYASGTEFFAGYIIAAIAGILFGTAMGSFKRVNYMASPFMNALYCTPRVTFLPLLIIWMGIGLWSKVVMVFLSALFPVLINTFQGVRGTDPRMVETARAYGARGHHIFFKVVMMSAIPFIVAGLRLGIGRGLIGMVVAELYGASEGLGFLTLYASNTMQTSKVFVAALLVASFGLFSSYLLQAFERRLAPWVYERPVE